MHRNLNTEEAREKRFVIDNIITNIFLIRAPGPSDSLR